MWTSTKSIPYKDSNVCLAVTFHTLVKALVVISFVYSNNSLWL